MFSLLILHFVVGHGSTDTCGQNPACSSMSTALLQHQLLSTSTTPEKGPKFILVSGGEGCGTTMLTEILSEAPNIIGIPTDWEVDDLSPTAQEKYSGIANFVGPQQDPFATLWKDDTRSYILNGADKRESEQLEMRAKAVEYLNQSLQGNQQVNTIVYHRSMPFEYPIRTKTPFLEDLPKLAKMLRGSTHLILVIRSQPASWLSHANPDDYMPFLERIENILAGNYTVKGLSMSIVSYEQLLCDPKTVLKKLADELGANLTSLLASPQLALSNNQAHRHDDDEEYQQKLQASEQNWEAVRHLYPMYDDFQRSHAALCD